MNFIANVAIGKKKGKGCARGTELFEIEIETGLRMPWPHFDPENRC